MDRLKKFYLLVVLVLLSTLPATVVWAHGHTHVGDYELEVGFHVEPAYQGEPNGVDLFVAVEDTGEPVNGVEETLKVEVIYGSSKKEMALEPQFGEEGAYIAYFIPSEVGDYTFRFFGDIQGTPVDVSMTSSPDTFSSVESKESASFPAEVSASNQAVQTGDLTGILGLLLGAIALVVSLLALRAARRPAA